MLTLTDQPPPALLSSTARSSVLELGMRRMQAHAPGLLLPSLSGDSMIAWVGPLSVGQTPANPPKIRTRTTHRPSSLRGPLSSGADERTIVYVNKVGPRLHSAPHTLPPWHGSTRFRWEQVHNNRFKVPQSMHACSHYEPTTSLRRPPICSACYTPLPATYRELLAFSLGPETMHFGGYDSLSNLTCEDRRHLGQGVVPLSAAAAIQSGWGSNLRAPC